LTVNRAERLQAAFAVASGQTAKAAVALTISRILALVSTAATVLLLGYVLPERDFGAFSFFAAIAGLAVLFGEGGLSVACRRTAEGRPQEQLTSFFSVIAIVGTVLGLVVVVGLACLRLLVIRHLGPEYLPSEILPALVCVPGLLWKYGLTEVYMGLGYVRRLALVRDLPQLATLAVIVVVHFWGGLDLMRAALALVLPALMLSVLAVALSRPRFSNLRRGFSDLGRELRFGATIYATRGLAAGLYKLDTPMIGIFLDVTSVGTFYLARAMVAPFALLSQNFLVVLFRSFVKMSALPRAVQRSFHLYGLIGLLVTFWILPWLAAILYPASARELGLLLEILSLRVFFTIAYSLYNRYLYARGEAGILLRSSVFIGIVNVALLLLLVPTMGLVGAAVADVLVCAVYYVVMRRGYRSHRASQSEEGAAC
jgi:O-antigen/teichoic acid export membrane protein